MLALTEARAAEPVLAAGEISTGKWGKRSPTDEEHSPRCSVFAFPRPWRRGQSAVTLLPLHAGRGTTRKLQRIEHSVSGPGR